MPTFEVQTSYRIEGYNYDQVEAETAEEAEEIIKKRYALDDDGYSRDAMHEGDFRPDLDLMNNMEVELCGAYIPED